MSCEIYFWGAGLAEWTHKTENRKREMAKINDSFGESPRGGEALFLVE